MPYKLVPPDKIPLAEDVGESQEDIVNAYKVAVALSVLCVKERGVGISATQVGIPLKIFVVKNNLNSDHYFDGFEYYVNCSYSPVGNETYGSIEGCLSLLNEHGELRYFEVNRPTKINLVGKKINGKNPLSFIPFEKVIEAEKGSSVFAHETDHSYGITIDKIGIEQGVSIKKKKKS